MATISQPTGGYYSVPELLARCEDKLGLLYRLYADMFPAHRDFWISLSDKETDYARLIRTLSESVKSGKIMINDNAFRSTTLTALYTYLLGEIRRAETERLTPINAVSIAMTIEQSVIKIKHLEYFMVMTHDAQNILHRLAEESMSLREKIRAQWEVVRYTHEQ